MPYLSISGLEFENNIVTFKISKEIKIPKFGTKNALFGYFWPQIS